MSSFKDFSRVVDDSGSSRTPIPSFIYCDFRGRDDIYGCRNPAIPNYKYCATHACYSSAEVCQGMAAAGQIYCELHLCTSTIHHDGQGRSRCRNEVANHSASTSSHGWLKFCDEHRCRAPKCRHEVDSQLGPGGQYCHVHTCAVDGCGLFNSTDHKYCLGHRCLYRFKDQANGPCWLPRNNGSDKCALHAQIVMLCPKCERGQIDYSGECNRCPFRDKRTKPVTGQDGGQMGPPDGSYGENFRYA
ncbi:hypothetical protein BJ875DRAFT_469958 [Amylocarpus encephaloides]|uniref:Uncharacterized protein n=1 Tax=Amylocarpus encephaloides TaxID=45428 RepID=A0A9P7YD51_9HELO|nr:hypothetical protein BJ875DRAFT_469958 [Amylocarpus encephaloides]